MSDSGEEQAELLVELAYLLSDLHRSTRVRGYSFRATPPCIATALRFAKRRLYLGLWHEWTAEVLENRKKMGSVQNSILDRTHLSEF
jgi:hypothetical protein